MKLKGFLTALLLIGLLAILRFWKIETIKPAPVSTFTTLTGKKIELVKLQGKPVIVTFWATDCPACIKDIPHLIELYNRFHPKGLEIIAVAMFYDLPSHVLAMTKAKQLPYTVALDLKAEHAIAFGRVQLTPSTFLISPLGDIVMQKTGVIDITEMNQQLENFFKG